MQADECPYRIYRRRGRTAKLIATAPDMESVGVAIVTLAGEQEFADAALGLLYRPDGPETRGTWLVNPWTPGKTIPRSRGRVRKGTSRS